MTQSEFRQSVAEGGKPQEQRKQCPTIAAFLAIACTVLAGLGDWKVLNNAYGGLPKAVVLGTIVCAFICLLVVADFANIKKAVRYFPIFLIPIAVYVLVSMYIWITDLSNATSITRAGEKILYQLIAIVYTVFMCYLLEDRAVNYLFFSMCHHPAGAAQLRAQGEHRFRDSLPRHFRGSRRVHACVGDP